MPAPVTSRRVILPLVIAILLALSLMPARYALYGPPLHNAAMVVLGVLTNPLNALGARLHEKKPEVAHEQTFEQYQRRVLEMEGEIDQLKAEVTRLREENEQLSGFRGRFGEHRYRFIAAHVTARSPDPAAETFTIDRGTVHGLEVGAIVVDGPHLLGRVVQVQRATAAVEPLAAKGRTLKVALGSAPERAVFFKSDGSGLLIAANADRRLQVSPGDPARLADDFGLNPWPEAAKFMLIGRVERAEPDLKNPLWQRIEVRPLRSLLNQNDVTVVVPTAEGDSGKEGKP